MSSRSLKNNTGSQQEAEVQEYEVEYVEEYVEYVEEYVDENVDEEEEEEEEEATFYEGGIGIEEGALEGAYSSDVEAPTKDKEYKILSMEELVDTQQESICKVSELVQLGSPEARILLMSYSWDVEKLMNQFFELGRDVICKKAGIVVTEDSLDKAKQDEIITCDGCCDDVPHKNSTALNCGHRFCNECWKTYITMKIEEGQSKRITCMGYKCNMVFDEVMIPRFVTGKVLSKYTNKIAESYVEDNARVKWCPSAPHCGNAVEIAGNPFMEVHCQCSKTFCFSCLQDPHTPCSCDMLKLWMKKCKDDSETANWLASNTKECPKCGKVIEKNGGCNLMTCSCGNYFCWLCGQTTGQSHTWEKIEGHSCGRYKEEKEKQAGTAATHLKRYLHYYERFKNNADTKNKADKLKADIQMKVNILMSSDCPAYEIQWIEAALDKIFECRQILAYSYVFAYYMFDDRQVYCKEITAEQRSIYKNLFEDHQEQMEATTEKLSQRLELPVDQMLKQENVRRDIMNLTILADRRCRAVFDVIMNDILGDGMYGIKIANFNPTPVATPSSMQAKNKNFFQQQSDSGKPDSPKDKKVGLWKKFKGLF